MKEIIIWLILSGTLFISFLALLLIGAFRKNRVIIFSSLVTLAIALGSAFWTSYLLLNKSYHKVTETLRPRTGDEIYSALFGKSESDCVKILNYQDQKRANHHAFVLCRAHVYILAAITLITLIKLPALGSESFASRPLLSSFAYAA
jgi:hypothetical protein